MTADIPQEAVERMVRHVRNMASDTSAWRCCPHCEEARAIVSLLPPPADPDKEAIREIVDWYMRAPSYSPDELHMALLKRGRELALKARDGE